MPGIKGTNEKYVGTEINGLKIIRFLSIKRKKFRQRIISANGIDRQDNAKGYIPGNCVSCCRICNYAKHALTLEEFKSWIQRLIEFNANKKSE